MSESNYDDVIQFRVGPEKAAAELADQVHVGGINVSELARQGLVAMLRRSLTDEDKIRIYERYDDGAIDEAVARVLLGDDLDTIPEETAAFEAAMKRDTSSFLVE